jgi:protein HOOK3
VYARIDLETATESSRWLAKKKNLEQIHKSLVRYMNNHCDFPPSALREPLDFNAIAEHNDVEETIKVND